MKDIFLKIISREIPAHIIWENTTHIAFLDIKPIQKGHTLVIPKKQYDYLFDMDSNDYFELMLATKEVARYLKEKLKCNRVCVIIEGYAVPHVHIHLIPTNSETDLEEEKRLNGLPQNYFEEMERVLKKLV